jgi:hypothetical protein
MLLCYIDETTPGIHRYGLNLQTLYRDRADRRRFEHRWCDFAASDPDHADLFRRDDDMLIYPTESFLTRNVDTRPSVLLVLGNPASQSVRAGMCFAFERGSQYEHRFWRALRSTGWLSFNEPCLVEPDVAARNAQRRDQLLSGRYQSPFRLGIDVFFTFPSPASTPRWSGVSGLKTLFGSHAFRLIATAERERLAQTIARFMMTPGAVVAFQRDAYEGLRANAAPPYAAPIARDGLLASPSTAGHPVPLFGAPPTRLAHTRAFHQVLHTYAASINRAPGVPA